MRLSQLESALALVPDAVSLGVQTSVRIVLLGFAPFSLSDRLMSCIHAFNGDPKCLLGVFGR